MHWLVVGLGNPGKRYELTRHNAGFMTVDLLADKKRLGWKELKKFSGQISVSKELLLLKPETYMNASGESVRKVVDFYKLKSETIILIHDDLDLTLGQAKVSWAKGPHIHNGILSVERELKTKYFWRVRVGVDSRSSEERGKIKGEEYVLRRLGFEESKLMRQGVSRAEEVVEDIIKGRYVVNE